MKHLNVVPAIIVVAQHPAVSVSELVALLQQHGFGGARSCRKLIHRLERLELIEVAVGVRGDRREKAVQVTSRSKGLLSEIGTMLAGLLR